MTQATQTSTKEAQRKQAARLAPFVPQLALDMAHLTPDEPGATGHNVHRVIDGSMLSADISGFTALSERLARKGREGAEELTALINACFAALIDAAGAFGGEVIKFGGDALLILFREDDHRRRAAQAGQSMQVALRSIGLARRAHLSMTVGVAEGPFNVFLVGSNARELLVCGPAATEVIRLEAAAASGQVLASAAIASSLRSIERDGGIVIWTDPEPRESAELPRDDLTPFVPRAVVEQLSAFSDTGGEHRLVTVGFVSLSGIEAALNDIGPAATAIELGAVVDAIDTAGAEYAVTALHSDIAPDGVKFVLCAGAPLSAGNSSDALLQTALRISTVRSRFVLKQGVQRGRVFAGFLGSRERRNYTLMGDAVNTAARMLGRAEDRDIIAVTDVVRDTRSIFVAEELEPFLVKGKAEPISAFRVLEITNEVRRSGEYADLVGRDSELAAIAEAIEQRGVFVRMTGAGGSGKSRLIDQVRDAVDLAGFGRFQSTCSPYGSAQPYALFRSLLRSGFGMDIHTDAETTGDLLTKVVKQYAPDLTPWLPLLAVPFGAKVDSTPEADALGADFRRARTHEVVADFLETAFDLPVALVAEDVHWADDASLELLDYLARQTPERGWVMFTTARPAGESDFGADIDGAVTFTVGPLSEHAVRALAIDVSSEPLSDQEISLVIERSGGNPLFAIELARAVGRGGGDQLPDSVEKLISSRLDELSPDSRRLLRIASVFGMEMKERDLLDVLGVEAPDLDPPWDEVEEFLARSSDGSARFSNIVSHDAAYEGLPFKTRRRLHGIVASHIEASTEHPERIAGLLATHFSEAKHHANAWKYGVIAGVAAREAAANVEAVASYGRALESARYVPNLEPHEAVEVGSALADAQIILGRFEDARATLKYARKHNRALPIELKLMRLLGNVEEREGRMSDALRWYGRALTKLPAEPSGELAEQRALLELARAGIHHRRGDQQACIDAATIALAEAEAIDHAPSRALALDRLHIARTYLKLPDDDEYGLRALAEFTALNDLVSKTRVLNNLGIQAYFESDWDKASAYYADAMREGLAAGSVVDGVMAGLNSGEILSDQGRWSAAEEMLRSALRNWQSAGYAVGVAAAQLFLGVNQRRAGHWEEARTLLASSAATFIELGISEFQLDAESRLIELEIYNGRVSRAPLDEMLGALAVGHALWPRLKRASALSHHLAGNSDQALSEALAAVEGSTGYERAVTLRTLCHIAPDHADTAPWRAEADSIFDLLGVAEIAAFPE